MTAAHISGEDWLKQLAASASQATAASSSSLRYSREQIIDLFKKDTPAPPGLDTFSSIFREACTLPMALRPVADDEKLVPRNNTRGRGSRSLQNSYDESSRTRTWESKGRRPSDTARDAARDANEGWTNVTGDKKRSSDLPASKQTSDAEAPQQPRKPDSRINSRMVTAQRIGINCANT